MVWNSMSRVITTAAVAVIAIVAVTRAVPTHAVNQPVYTLPFYEGFSISRGYSGSHQAIDYLVGDPVYGGEDIVAGASGTLKKCPYDPAGAGYYAVMNHGNGHRTRYLHLESNPSPPDGAGLARGQSFGKEGTTGDSTGPHLHFETRVDATTFSCAFDGVAQDPYGSTGYYLWTLNPPGYAPSACYYPVDSASGPGRYPGVFRTLVGATNWYEKFSHSGGAANRTFTWGVTCDIPVVGDWDGDGDQTPGIFRPTGPNGTEWILSNQATGGGTLIQFTYGTPTDWPVVGDWNYNGTQTPGLFRPSGQSGTEWHLNNLFDGSPDVPVFTFGVPTDRPVSGDWDDDGTTEVGVFKPGNNSWHLKSANTQGAGLVVPGYVFGSGDDYPLSGDWDWDGRDTPGVFRPSTARWYLNNDFDGSHDVPSFTFGVVSDKPITGDWN
jgi:hypothetical protein